MLLQKWMCIYIYIPIHTKNKNKFKQTKYKKKKHICTKCETHLPPPSKKKNTPPKFHSQRPWKRDATGRRLPFPSGPGKFSGANSGHPGSIHSNRSFQGKFHSQKIHQKILASNWSTDNALTSSIPPRITWRPAWALGTDRVDGSNNPDKKNNWTCVKLGK